MIRLYRVCSGDWLFTENIMTEMKSSEPYWTLQIPTSLFMTIIKRFNMPGRASAWVCKRVPVNECGMHTKLYTRYMIAGGIPIALTCITIHTFKQRNL